MKKKAILVIAPILPQRSDIALIASTLSFLEPYCHIDYVDPLSVIDENLDNDDYYSAWQLQISHYLESYETFIGFSFGGVILQQCFSLFEKRPLPVVLFSTPTFVDGALKQKLGAVIDLLKGNQVEQALSALYRDVFYPYAQPIHHWETLDREDAVVRLVTGLTRVLNTDSSNLVKTTLVDHLHLIGESSNLINNYNVLSPLIGLLLTVPGAGMRVLQDNLLFCKQVLSRYLNMPALL